MKLPNTWAVRSFWTAGAVAAGIAFWFAGRPALEGTENSPCGSYRLEYYNASFLQRMLHSDMKIPSIVRLYRVSTGELMGESGVVDLWLNGKADWATELPMQAVLVGRDVLFENVPSECRQGHDASSAQPEG